MTQQLSVRIQPVDYFPTHWPVTYKVTAEVDAPIELDDSDLEAAVKHALSRQHIVAEVVPIYRPPAAKPRPSTAYGPRPSQKNHPSSSTGPTEPRAIPSTPEGRP